MNVEKLIVYWTFFDLYLMIKVDQEGINVLDVLMIKDMKMV